MNSAQFGRFTARLLLSSMWVAHKCNLIQVHINQDQRLSPQSGGLVVFANHPSLIETIAMRYVLDTLHNGEVWSIADERLLPSAWYDSFQCIPVCRASQNDVRAIEINERAKNISEEIISSGGCIVVYPEGTRTCKALHTVTNSSGTKQVGVCRDTFLKLAAALGVTLQPTWIEHGNCSTPQGFVKGYLKLLRGIPIVLRFGSNHTQPVTPESIAAALLAASDQ